MKYLNRIVSFLIAFSIAFSVIAFPQFAHAGLFYEGDITDRLKDFLLGDYFEIIKEKGFEIEVGDLFSFSSIPQEYYTNPTESEEDEDGNVINYYKDGSTTNTQILDSYNQTFNTIHNVTTTNDYDANIALENFLNSYTTNTNTYTYNTEYKSWYYDNTSNTINYDASQTYYNFDDRQYYISIDNSTDEYYLVDIQYSPTYVTVNYIYNNTDSSVQHGNVTNVYYYQLTDGRNSATLSADDVLGLDLSYDVANFEQITDDIYTLSLQHFDNEYSDSSTYGRTFYSENRSTIYVDSGTFGKAVKLASGSAAGVQIPGLSGYDGLTFDFRIYYDKISSFEVFLGDSRLFGGIPDDTTVVFTDYYTDHGDVTDIVASSTDFTFDTKYYPVDYDFFPESVSTLESSAIVPKCFEDLGKDLVASKYGYVDLSVAPVCDSSEIIDYWQVDRQSFYTDPDYYDWYFIHTHYMERQYTWSAEDYIQADFAYSSYANQWVSMRITILDGYIFYFVNGDMVGVGKYTMPTADKFYIKSSGSVYLDELRVTTGDMVYNSTYVPSTAPYDTNKVLALPSELLEDVIYVRSSILVTSWRVGGVRPSNPSKGFLYIPLYSDYTAGQSQLYDGNNWVNVDTMIYDGSTTKTTKSHMFSPLGNSADINIGSDDSSDEEADTSCTHNWELTETVEPEYDTDGNETSAGYDLYTCSKCGEVFKDYDATGPPASDSGSDNESPSIVPDDLASFFAWLGQELGKLLGALLQGITTLLESTLGVLIDSLVSLITSAIEKISNLVSLFGSFGNALASLWSWLPPDIVNLISGAITIFLLLAVVKFFL